MPNTLRAHQLPIICLQLYGSYRLRSILIYSYREVKRVEKKREQMLIELLSNEKLQCDIP